MHRDLDDDSVLFTDGMEDLRVQHRLGAIHVLDETLIPPVNAKILALAVALIDELDLDAVIQEQLAQALGQDVVVELDVIDVVDAAINALRSHAARLDR